MPARRSSQPRRTSPLRLLIPPLLCVILLMFHGVALAAATPIASLAVPAGAQIGADFSFAATFDNSGTTGYGPFIDLVFPVTGADGDDGISFTSATYLGQPVTAVTLTFPAGGCVAHPYAQDTSHAPLQVCGTPGDTLVVLQLPFGSFTPAQPPAVVMVNAHLSDLSDLGTALTIRSRAGFQFGNDALDNPCCDPSIVNPSSISSTTWPGSSVTPTLLTLSKTYIGPEDETATGPNYPRQYRIDVDIAPGQTVANLQIQDLLPDNVQFVAVNSVTGGTVAGATDPSTTTPGGALSRTLSSVTGTTATNDASLLFTFYVPLDNSSGGPVIAAASGDAALALNNAGALGDWTPNDPRDPAGTGNVVVSLPGPEHILTARSIAIQKRVAIVGDTGPAGYSVGDTLEYTVQFQVSDYFAFQNVVINDTISDGQRDDTSFQPTLSVNGNGFTLGTAAMNSANVTVAPNYTPNDPAPNDGTTTFIFRVSNELMARGRPDGRWIGGCVPVAGTGGPAPDCAGSNDGATTATVKFRTIVQDEFSDTFPSGDPYVDSGDHLDNAVTITGDLLSVANTNNPTGFSEADTSGTSVNIVFGSLSKTVYAVNGSTSFITPVRVTAGDTVTYRIQYDLASSDFENLRFIDNLPLPIFNATEITAPLSGAAVPPAGKVAYGPADTYHMLSGVTPVVPTIAINAAENSLTFTYGTFNDPSNRQSTIDLLFTVTVSDQPFADRLFLTNQVHETDGSTNGPNHQADSIVQIVLTEPVLQIKKGVIGSDHAGATLTSATAGPVTFSPPGSGGTRWAGTIDSTGLAGTPIDSDISGVDTGDLVSYAIVVENTGTSQKGAFDVTITDTLPVGLIIPTGGAGLNMSVTYGDGTPLTYLPLGPSSSAADLFANGIKLDDPASAGACQKYDPNNGRNIIVITYDLMVDPTAPAGVVIPNRASITNYAGDEGGPNFVPVDHPTNIANTTIASPGLLKQLSGTEIDDANNGNSQAVIGELVNYTLTITAPEGVTSNAQIVDTLDSGLAFKEIVSVASSPGVSMSTPLGTGASPANVVVAAGGGTITFKPGTITNTDTDNTQSETITIVYQAVVLDVAGNQDTPVTLLNNSAAFSWTNGALPPVSAADVTVVEPILSTTKSVATTPATNADAGDPVAYTIVIRHAAASQTDAYDVTFSDPLPKVGAGGPSYIDNPTLTIADSAGLITSGSFSLTGSNAAGWTVATSAGGFDFARLAGRTLTLTINGTISSAARPGVAIPNSATTQWTSLAAAPGTRSIYNTSATERTGAGGINNYTSTGSASFTPAAPVLAKSIAATSEAHTTNVGGIERLAIGEIVRYHLTVQLPEGTSTDFQVHDFLPTGLTFLNDGSARVAFVSNGATGITSSSYGSGAGLIPAAACANTNGASGAVTPSCALADANISRTATTNSDTYASGDDPFFKLGTLLNNDSDGDGEFVVVEFNALVDNSTAGANIAGSNRNNNFGTFERNLSGTLVQVGSPSNTVNARISEPSIPFNGATNNKTVSPASGDAGDSVTYTLFYQNANGANNTDAFEVGILDNLPASVALTAGSINVSFTAACSSPAYTDNSSAAGNRVDLTVSRVAPNCKVTITYQATLKTTVSPGQLIVNTANLTYTSLSGPNGTTGNATGSNTPGASGAGNGERDGSGGINTYSGGDQAQVTVFVPAPQKSLVATSQADTSGGSLAIGEIARYRMVVRIAEGSSPNVQLRDSLPPGLRFLDDGSAKVALVSSDPGLSSSTLSGAGLAVAGDETTVNGITPSFVLPGPAISGGTGAGGRFLDGDDPTFSLGDLGNTDSDADQELVVVEFNALADNVASNQAGAVLNNTFDVLVSGASIATSNAVGASIVEPGLTIGKSVTPLSANAGDIVTFRVAITNTSTLAAYDAVIGDTIPSGLTYAPGSIRVISGPAGTTNDTSLPNLTWSFASVPAGASAVVEFKARINGSAAPAVPIVNTAGVTWTSTPGGNPDERTGVGDLLNDYSASSQATLSTAAYQVGKTLMTPAGGLAGVNDTLRFGITITNTGATPLATVPLTDSFAPALLQFLTASAAPDTTTAGLLTWNNLGPLAPGATRTITVDFRALAVTTGQPGGVTINYAGVSNGQDSNGTILAPRDSSAAVAIGAPDLRVTKSDGLAVVTPGSTLTYTLQLNNTGTYTATGVVMTETVPLNTTFAGGSVPWAAQGSGVYTYDLPGPLGIGQGTTLTFVVKLNDPLPAGVDTIANTAIAGHDGSHGPDATPGNNRGDDIDIVNAAPDLQIDKTDGDISTTVGGVVTYTLTYTNAGNQDATGVVITETVPAATTFNAGASTAGWNCTPNGSAGSVCTGTIGDLAVGGSGSVTFAVTVADPLPAGVAQIANTALIADDGTNGPDRAPADNTGGDTTPVTAQPDLRLSKTDGGVSATPGGVVAYTLTYTNTGSQGATGVTITETVPLNSSFDSAASVPTVWSCANGAPAGTTCTSAISGAVAGNGGTGSVRFVVKVYNPLPKGITQISNTALIGDDGTNGPDPTPANNASSATTSIDPTAITLVSFTATPQGDSIRVRWETGAEFNTWGFYLYRSADGDRDHAVRITPRLILGRGRSQGATYTWDDATAEEGVLYSYWLQEVELNGHTSEYGPARAGRGPVSAPYRLFLPLIDR